MSETMSIVYHGGLAAAGRLHFYEHSRANYGFARLLITAEHFRRTGRVAKKVSKQSYVELIIIAPKKGSFITEVVVPTLAEAVPKLAAVPLKAVVSYIFEIIDPRSSQTDETIVELAKIRLAEEKIKADAEVVRSKEETKRVETLERIISTQAATNKQALSLVRHAIRHPNTAVERLHPDKQELVNIEKNLEAEDHRQQEINKAQSHLKQLDPKLIAQLTSRVRPMISEMGKPLARSATYFTIAAANDDKPLAYLDAAKISAIESRELLDEPFLMDCRIRSYDRDAAVGKLTSDELTRPLNFVVPADRKVELQPVILSAMEDHIDTVRCEVLKVVDKSSQPTSLVLISIDVDHLTRQAHD